MSGNFSRLGCGAFSSVNRWSIPSQLSAYDGRSAYATSLQDAPVASQLAPIGFQSVDCMLLVGVETTIVQAFRELSFAPISSTLPDELLLLNTFATVVHAYFHLAYYIHKYVQH